MYQCKTQSRIVWLVRLFKMWKYLKPLAHIQDMICCTCVVLVVAIIKKYQDQRLTNYAYMHFLTTSCAFRCQHKCNFKFCTYTRVTVLFLSRLFGACRFFDSCVKLYLLISYSQLKTFYLYFSNFNVLKLTCYCSFPC